ncbi:MAG TPA: ATP synthase F1 subunit gamma [Candidatus Methylomirabilis sp.]|nr:ATP synthase F1 subunit gamma [Candidatus Methylomirabilis sp.]
MATLRDIRRRINSVKSTQQITRAMKLVAAAKLRRAQERILEARPYSYKMGEVLSDLALRSPRELHPLLAERQAGGNGHTRDVATHGTAVETHRPGVGTDDEVTRRKMLVIISGDRGLCGAFNSNIIRRSVDFLRGYQDDPEIALTLIVVGRKIRDYYRRRGQYTLRSEYANFFDKLAYSHAAQIGQDLIRAYVEEEVDEVHLLYNEFKSVATQRVVVEQLLPIQPSPVPPDASIVEFLFEPSPDAILERLLPKHVEVQVYRALMESLAAEYGARMTAMENATRNASEMIDLLTIQFNKARQERITKELLEIVGGAEALRQARG